jgi:hypothetical protein
VCGMVSNIRRDKFHIYLEYDYFSYFETYKLLAILNLNAIPIY